MASSTLALIRDQFRLTTWLLIGACLQTLLFLLLPSRIASLPATCLLALRIIQIALMSKGLIHDTSLDNVLPGRRTAQIPNEDGSFADKPADKEVVVFVVGARSNHLKGPLAPGFRETGNFIANMWKDAEVNRTKWGFLGRSSSLVATDDEAGNAIITLSYWKDMESLHAFARGTTHRAGWDWWNATIKQHPHIGIMHEVYAVPKGHWENMYINFQPLAMGQTEYALEQHREGADLKPRLMSPLIEARGTRWKSMLSRMGRLEAI